MGKENFSEMRKAMVVSQLRTSDVSDPRLISVMSKVPREDFVPAAHRAVAYSDRGVPVGTDRALNAPLSTGLLLNAAALTKEDNVLLIGAATGYTATILSRLTASVVAIEQSSKLASAAKKNLADLANVQIEKSNHGEGFAAKSLYSVIIIDGTVDEIPDTLVDQLLPEGRLVAAICDNGVTRLAIGRKAGGVIGYQYFADCGGCTLPGFDKPKNFQF